MSKAMVVLSGGQDSTTSLYWAKREFDLVYAVTFDYGQRHKVEVEQARIIAGMAGVVEHTVIEVPNILRSRSPLTSPTTPLETYTDHGSMADTIGNRVELTFVPMRNALFLTIAANIAVAVDCYDLVTGVCQEDNANYPDCRQMFITDQEETVNSALGIDRFKIHTPLMSLSKAGGVSLAVSLPGCMVAMAESHTCYDGKRPPCGECHACVLRAHGFAEAGVPDPIITPWLVSV